ncbi:hypothetical protein OHR68_35395 [Spirillospora sp. NBC_00431]
MSAVIKTPNGCLLALRQPFPGKPQRHLLPGRTIDQSAPFEDVLRRILRQQLNINTTIGALIKIAKTGDHDEYIFVVHADEHNTFPEPDSPTSDGYYWDAIEPTPQAIHAANFTPKEIGFLFAGHLRHGQPPWTLPDIRSRPPAKRRHHKTR